jgi:hypothetical protein
MVGWCGVGGVVGDEAGFVSLFDGESLRGWEQGKSAGVWSVVDGVIVGDGDKGVGYLSYERKHLEDFELRLSYRFPTGKGNSGISVRAVADEKGKRAFKSYHADLGHVGIGGRILGAWDFHTPGRREHGCYRGQRLVIDGKDVGTVEPIVGAVTAEDLVKKGWNKVRLVVRGNRFQFYLNGKLSSEFVEHLPQARRLRSGMVQLQVHDPGMVVEFKDVRMREIRSGAGGAGGASTPEERPK